MRNPGFNFFDTSNENGPCFNSVMFCLFDESYRVSKIKQRGEGDLRA